MLCLFIYIFNKENLKITYFSKNENDYKKLIFIDLSLFMLLVLFLNLLGASKINFF